MAQTDTIITLGFDAFYRSENDMLIALGFCVRSDQRNVTFGDSEITIQSTGDSEITKQTNGDSEITKQTFGDSEITIKSTGDSEITISTQAVSEIPAVNLFPGGS